MHCFTANSFYKQTCEYSCSKAIMSHNINLLISHFTISYALHSCQTINRKVNCGLTPIAHTPTRTFVVHSWLATDSPRDSPMCHCQSDHGMDMVRCQLTVDQGSARPITNMTYFLACGTDMNIQWAHWHL